MTSFVVVGAGPAGCISAKVLASLGEVILFEEHKLQPVQCAGLISVSGLKLLGVDPGDSVLNTIEGGRFFTEEGRMVELNTKSKKAYVVDRRRFDELLLYEAEDAGASVIRERVVDVSHKKVKTKLRSVSAEKIVLASGVDLRFHRKLSLDHPKRFLVGAQVDLPVDCDPTLVEVHANVPGFFSWIIPTGEVARVGVCARTNPMPYLNSFIKKLASDGRIRKSKPRNRVYGLIPVYDPHVKTDYGWVLSVGDAAGQVKATTGGGIILGGIAASLIGEENYEKAWRKKIGRELYLHLTLRKLIDRVSAKNTDVLFNLLESGVNALKSGGDMDYASKTLKSLFVNPEFVCSLFLNAPHLMLSLL